MILTFYKKLQTILEKERCVLMVVINNQGSSPGRKGFKMVVTENEMYGTIGGGIMEHKLVEYAQSLLEKPFFNPFIKRQIHDKSAPKDQSGMICSGEQTIAFFDLNATHLPLIGQIVDQAFTEVYYSNLGIRSNSEVYPTKEWQYVESISNPNKVYIIGGGHVGLALSEVLSRLDFEIHLLDHRDQLNTMLQNTFAHSKQTVDFEAIETYIPEGNTIYVVIMSFGYRTDSIIIKRLLGRNFKYIGLLGSKEKIATLFESLDADGFDKNQIARVHAPIGLDIKSETTHEIAISVAAEIIQVKNKF